MFVTSISFGQSKCYLEYHMKYGFAAKEFCWGSNTKKFLDTLSTEARAYLDSVFNKFGANPETVICQKVSLNESSKYISMDYTKKANYYYTVFERTFDCFDNHTFQNFKGKVKIKKDTKIILEYLLGIKGNYETLRIYVINQKPLINSL